MKVVDLYIAVVFLGLVAGAGWVAHASWTAHEERVRRLEQKTGLSPVGLIAALPQADRELVSAIVSALQTTEVPHAVVPH